MKFTKPLSLLFALFAFFSCKKDIVEPSVTGNGQTLTLAGTATYPLNWENIDFMPTPPGVPTVVVPWGSGASVQFTREIANDYHQADGWELVYNTFNTTTTPDNWYFILYNVYRGLWRLYYYVPPTANYISSANIVHALSTEGTYAVNSPIMNFAAKDIVRADTNYTTASMVEQWQVARSTWYVFQYELAYDQNMSTQNFTSFSFKWPVRSTQITNVNINGIVSGTLTGSIAVAGSNLTVSPTFNIDASKGKSTLTVNGSSDAEKLKPSLGQTIVNAIKSGLTSGIQGIAKNILSGLFKKSSNTTDENVNLKLQAKVSLQGTLTSDFLITSPVLAIPGYNQSTTPGILPAYGQPLGVFYITSKPTITNTRTVTMVTTPDGNRERHFNYAVKIVSGSYQFYFNPAVTSIATIQNLQVDVVSLEPDSSQYEKVFGTLETIPGYTLAYGHVTGGRSIMGPMGMGQLALRVKFEVVPNSGAPAAVISKTFAANVVNVFN